ncbi:MAG: hypothetical protein J7500_02620 [Sphingomonas sp.]|uniref:hypothetical protein n=1 Tax=Sphingomonas sp. TaxID=28214 RepID=UPI001B1BF245|nr:hypothetical protein [Sphingomonas sp.]MBO9621584.1 hypothetical protein [Sphingomonas sp.]
MAEVIIHEGYVDRKEGARLAKAEARGELEAAKRDELASTLQACADLRRHTAMLPDSLGIPASRCWA